MRMRVSSRRVLPSAAAALLVLALGIESSRAAEDPPDEQEIQGRGFAPGKLYQFENIDTINAFSGNLNLTIPLGGRYSVGGPLEYGFTLSYNAAAWTYFFQANGSCNNPDEELWIQGVPTPTANSGLGWMVSWGYLVPPGHPILNNSGSFLAGWLWIGSDGGHHYTWKTPHEEDADSDPSEWFTRDGTYARLQLDAGGSGIHELELPDGTIQTFEVGVHDNTIWEVTQMRDPFGNSVTIDRTAPDTNHWTVSDDQGRQHFIVFDDEPCDGFPCDLPGRASRTSRWRASVAPRRPTASSTVCAKSTVAAATPASWAPTTTCGFRCSSPSQSRVASSTPSARQRVRTTTCSATARLAPPGASAP